MESINLRIKKIRKKNMLTQKDFGEKIGMKANSISDIENEKNAVTEYVIKLVCSKFNINEDWLRTGSGGDDNMFKKEFLEDEYMTYTTEIGLGANDRIKQAIIKYGRLSPENKKIIDDALDLLSKMLTEE